MNRFDIIKQMSKTEMADWLCTLMTDIADEDEGDACYKICPAQHLCKPSDIRGYGWFEYLTKEPGTGKGYFKEMEFAVSRFFEWSDQAIKEAKGETK